MRRFRFARTDYVAADPVEVHRVLVDLEWYPTWWPQVRAVAKIDDDTAAVVCQSTLPYRLDLVLHATSREAGRLEVDISGDLAGWARWRIEDDHGTAALHFEQEVQVRSVPLSAAAWLMRPALGWNHRRMMDGAVVGLRRKLS